jgi:hypothetical protein
MSDSRYIGFITSVGESTFGQEVFDFKIYIHGASIGVLSSRFSRYIYLVSPVDSTRT